MMNTFKLDAPKNKQKLHLEELADAFENWDKWRTYGVAFRLLDEGKIRLIDIMDAACDVGIKPSIIKMRLNDWRRK
jgi:hypothetical protein